MRSGSALQVVMSSAEGVAIGALRSQLDELPGPHHLLQLVDRPPRYSRGLEVDVRSGNHETVQPAE